jgi:hypothetical protein
MWVKTEISTIPQCVHLVGSGEDATEESFALTWDHRWHGEIGLRPYLWLSPAEIAHRRGRFTQAIGVDAMTQAIHWMIDEFDRLNARDALGVLYDPDHVMNPGNAERARALRLRIHKVADQSAMWGTQVDARGIAEGVR